jgi:hypothetical protein
MWLQHLKHILENQFLLYPRETLELFATQAWPNVA